MKNKQSSKQIFLLYATDVFKSTSSQSLIFVGTSQQKSKMKIAKEIEEGNMEYFDSSLPAKTQSTIFKKDWTRETRSFLNSRLVYGYFDYVYDNEEL